MTQAKKPFLVIEKVVRWALDYPKSALVFSFVLVFVSLWGLPKTKLELDLYDSYNQDFPSLTQTWKMKEEFQDSSSLYLLAEWPSSPNGETLCAFIKKLDQAEASLPETKSVFHIFKVRGIHSEPEKYWYPTLLEDPCLYRERSLSEHLKTWDPKIPFQILNQGENSLLVQIQFKTEFKPQTVGSWLRFMKSPQYRLSAVGPGTFRYYIHEIIQKDSKFNLLLILFFIFFIRFFMGTWRIGLYYIMTVLLTSVTLAGFMGLFSIPLDILSNNLFILTAIAGTADFLFVGWGLKRGKSLRESFLQYSRPCFFTTLTTMIGFLSLLTSNLTMIKHFGSAAAMGAILEWIFTLLTWPAIATLLGHETKLVTQANSAFLSRIKRLNSWTPPKTITLVFVVLAAMAPILFFSLKFEENPLKNFPENHELKVSHNHFSEKTGWLGVLNLVFPKSLNSEVINRCIEQAKKVEDVKAVQNPIAVRNFFLNGLSPLRQETVEHDLRRYGGLKSYFSDESTRSFLFLKEISPQSIDHLNQEIKKVCPAETEIIGQSQVYREVSEVLSKTLTDSFTTSILIVLLIIWFLQLRLKNKDYVSVTISIIAGPFMMITLMSLFKIAINPMNSLFLSVLVGITGDNAIQYLFGSTRSDLLEGTEENGVGSIVISSLMILSSFFFLFQTLIPMKILGILFAAGFTLNLVGDLWLLKGLLNIKNYLMKRSIGPNTEPPPNE